MKFSSFQIDESHVAMAEADCAIINPEGHAWRVLNQGPFQRPLLAALCPVLAFHAKLLLTPLSEN